MISDDTREFMESLSGGMLCTRSADNRPSAHECLLREIGPNHFIGYVPERLSKRLEENVADNGQAAIVTSRTVGDHRSVQLKGRITEIAGPTDEPEVWGPMIETVRPSFHEWFEADVAEKILTAMGQERVYRVRFEVEQVFDQTPGPKAGNQVSGGAA
jgi:hypothetical protein